MQGIRKPSAQLVTANQPPRTPYAQTSGPIAERRFIVRSLRGSAVAVEYSSTGVLEYWERLSVRVALEAAGLFQTTRPVLR